MNNPTNRNDRSERLERWSAGAKDFYSPGSTLSTLSCAALVLTVWRTVAHWGPFFAKEGCAWAITALVVFGYALVLPEPPGYANAGKLRLTLAEMIFGSLDVVIVVNVVLALKGL